MKRKNVWLCSLLTCCMVMTACFGTLTADAKGFMPITSNRHDIKEQKQTIVGVIQSVDESSITVSVMGRAKNNKIEEVAADDEYGIMLIEELLEEEQETEVTEESTEESNETETTEEEATEEETLVEEETTEEETTEVENEEQEEPIVKPEMEATVQTIPITTETTIMDMKHNTLDVSELTVSSMVIIQLDESGNAVSITVSDKEFGNKKPLGNEQPDKQNEGSPNQAQPEKQMQQPQQPQQDKQNQPQQGNRPQGGKGKR